MSRDPISRARIRLAFQFAVVCALLLVGAGGGVYLYVRHALHAAFDGAHDLAIRSVLENVEAGPSGLDVRKAGFIEEFDELRGTLGVVSASLWSADGRKLADAGVDVAPRGPARELSGSGDALILIRREPVRIGHAAGVVVVARHAADLARDLAAFRRGLVLFLPLALLGALGAGWIMAGRSLRPVRQAFDEQRAFMADASHEIRTPLSIIQTHAEVPLDGETDISTMKASLDVVARTAGQLGVLVNDLLYLARSDATGISPSRVPFDLEELLEETVEAFGPLAATKGSRIVLGTFHEVEMTADPSQLQRLVGILIDNALRHGLPGEIEVSAKRNGKNVEVCVSDVGPGIPEDMLPRVFDRFVRGEASRTSNGHGLGLAIARSIVNAHGGSLKLDQNARGGTTASVTIPVAGRGREARPILEGSEA